MVTIFAEYKRAGDYCLKQAIWLEEFVPDPVVFPETKRVTDGWYLAALEYYTFAIIYKNHRRMRVPRFRYVDETPTF